MKPVIQTYIGQFVDLAHPHRNVLNIYDIAHSLSLLCRFNGHGIRHWSVAAHSLLVSALLPDELALDGLMHDSAEAYLGDVSSPLKTLLPDYKQLESIWNDEIDHQFNVSVRHPLVREADLRALQIERTYFMPHGDAYWEVCSHLPSKWPVHLWYLRKVDAREIYPEFLRRHSFLSTIRGPRL